MTGRAGRQGRPGEPVRDPPRRGRPERPLHRSAGLPWSRVGLAVLLAAGFAWTLPARVAAALRGPAGPVDPAIHRVDLDDATEAELRLLPGVGVTLARRILDERDRGGPFVTPENLARRVRGVGPVRVRSWREEGLLPGDTPPPPAPAAGEGDR